MKIRKYNVVAITILLIMSFVTATANAQNRRNTGVKKTPHPVTRQNHALHRYHPVGHKLRVLPAGYYSLLVAGVAFYYHSGVYYRRNGPDYIVVNAPIGAVLHTLPIGYRMIHIGGHPYYYANGVYYLWDQINHTYVVAERPAVGTPDVATETKDESHDIFVYPAAGQNQEQTSRDRYECYLWSVEQSGYDPSKGDSGNFSNYRRAMQACLEGRNYTVK
jgi:Family of unknown function (DUF6515)